MPVGRTLNLSGALESTNMRDRAKRLIADCQNDLGRKLSAGECRDLLMDNTDWDSGFIATMVDAIQNDIPSALV